MNEYIIDILKSIMLIDSPSGFCKNVTKFLEVEANNLGFKTFYTNKGNLIIEINGEDDNNAIGVCAHVDTLGLMVRSIKADGTLALTKVGGPIMSTLDGEYCKVYARNGKVYTGTILSNSPAIHVFKDASTLERTEDTMSVKLDEIVKCKDDVVKLGIENGDYIAYDSKTVVTETGFIKSRFLDDKLSVAILFGALKEISLNKLVLPRKTYFMLSTYEEVGHGMAWIPSDIKEVLAIDMGCIGLDLACTEYDVSICVKDSSGPYDQDLTNLLVNLAKDLKLSYATDIYPYYGSDVSATLRAGNDIKGALIGAGVAASHGMERSHISAVENTYKLLIAYLKYKA